MNESTEQYLKEIYKLGGAEKLVGIKEIAEALNIKPPSVTEKAKKLQDEGYISIIPYRGISLKEKGIELAVETLASHRLWEVFLYEHLKMDISEVHEEACKLEHATSLKVQKKLRKFLNNPRTSPHGKEIKYEE